MSSLLGTEAPEAAERRRPDRAAPETRADRLDPTGPEPSDKVIRVLVCDDDPRWRCLASIALADEAGIEFLDAVSDGADAVGACIDRDVDVLVMDDLMPFMTGLEALPHLHEFAPATKVLIMSSNPQAVDAAFAGGADAFCVKDIVLSSLPRIVRTLGTLARR